MKVYARIECVSRISATSSILFEVSYVLLTGAKRSDRALLDPGALTTESALVHHLKQQLQTFLQSRYTPETFAVSDIALFGG